jgi:hypothetical protein
LYAHLLVQQIANEYKAILRDRYGNELAEPVLFGSNQSGID